MVGQGGYIKSLPRMGSKMTPAYLTLCMKVTSPLLSGQLPFLAY